MPPDPKDAPFPTKQLIIIGICRFSEPLAFNSILAYSFVMVKDLGINHNDASFYSGLLVSAYAVAEAMTALGWGTISDVYGRKPVALIGLGGVAVTSIVFGMAQTYWVALLARFIGGALNGNVAIMQTMVAEMVKNPAHEPKAYATQPFVWTLGGIIGSAMGGFLARPAVNFPSVFSQDGIFGRYPYLLPNLAAAIGIVLAIIQGVFLLEETNPALSKEDSEAVADGEPDERTPLHRASVDRDSLSRLAARNRARSLSIAESIREIRKRPSFIEDSLPLPVDQRFDLRRSSFGTMHSIKIPHHDLVPATQDAPLPKKTFNYTIIMLTVALTIAAYHQMAFVTLLPVHLLDERKKPGLDLIGGLDLSIPEVGTFLAVNGLITLFIQGTIFPIFVERVGVWKSFVWMCALYPITYVIPPFWSAFPGNTVIAAIYLPLVLQAFFGIILFPCALILLKNATPSPLVLGRVNGLAMSACCLARTVSPPLAGIFYSVGGSAAAWLSLVAVAFLGTVQMFWVPKEHIDKVEVENGLKHVITTERDHIDEEAVED